MAEDVERIVEGKRIFFRRNYDFWYMASVLDAAGNSNGIGKKGERFKISLKRNQRLDMTTFGGVINGNIRLTGDMKLRGKINCSEISGRTYKPKGSVEYVIYGGVRSSKPEKILYNHMDLIIKAPSRKEDVQLRDRLVPYLKEKL